MLVTLPSVIAASSPNWMLEPILEPITAGRKEIEPSLNLIFASGTSRPFS